MESVFGLADSSECPPVQTDKVESLIEDLMPGKAPGLNAIPLEIFKKFLKWWAPFLAVLFTVIDKTGVMPDALKNTILVPVFKKRRLATSKVVEYPVVS